MLTIVGASLLAKNVNDYACIQDKRCAFGFFASRPQAGTRSYKKA